MEELPAPEQQEEKQEVDLDLAEVGIPESILRLQDLEITAPVSFLLPGREDVHWLYGNQLEDGPSFHLLKTNGKAILGEARLDLYVDHVSVDENDVYLSSWNNEDEGSALMITLLSAEDLALLGSWKVQSPRPQAQMAFSAVERGFFLQHQDNETTIYHVDEKGVAAVGRMEGNYCHGSVAPSGDRALLYENHEDREAPLARTEPWRACVRRFDDELLFDLEILPRQSHMWSDDGAYLVLYSSSENFFQNQTVFAIDSGEQVYPKGRDARYRVEVFPLNIGEGNSFLYRSCPATGCLFY